MPKYERSDQVYAALGIAAGKMGTNNFKQQTADWLKSHKNLKKFTFTVTPEHRRVTNLMCDLSVDDEICMAYLHDYDVMKQRFPDSM